MRLIDADGLIEKLGPEYKATIKLIKKGEVHLDNIAEGYKEAHDLIIWSPTIEAEPVRHGHWTEQPWADEEYGRLVSNYECSICKVWSREDYNYCPNCGAKMINERR